ncbi:MAG: glutathione S-transferase N-terminal domain-containing protein, partial [Pseudomonadales bacterium]
MKLFGYAGAPNPRKVEIFLAEKAIDFELVTVDLSSGEHQSKAFLQKNSQG